MKQRLFLSVVIVLVAVLCLPTAILTPRKASAAATSGSGFVVTKPYVVLGVDGGVGDTNIEKNNGLCVIDGEKTVSVPGGAPNLFSPMSDVAGEKIQPSQFESNHARKWLYNNSGTGTPPDMSTANSKDGTEYGAMFTSNMGNSLIYQRLGKDVISAGRYYYFKADVKFGSLASGGDISNYRLKLSIYKDVKIGVTSPVDTIRYTEKNMGLNVGDGWKTFEYIIYIPEIDSLPAAFRNNYYLEAAMVTDAGVTTKCEMYFSGVELFEASLNLAPSISIVGNSSVAIDGDSTEVLDLTANITNLSAEDVVWTVNDSKGGAISFENDIAEGGSVRLKFDNSSGSLDGGGTVDVTASDRTGSHFDTKTISYSVDYTPRIEITEEPTGLVRVIKSTRVQLGFKAVSYNDSANRNILWSISDSLGQTSKITLSSASVGSGEGVIVSIDNTASDLQSGVLTITADFDGGIGSPIVRQISYVSAEGAVPTQGKPLNFSTPEVVVGDVAETALAYKSVPMIPEFPAAGALNKVADLTADADTSWLVMPINDRISATVLADDKDGKESVIEFETWTASYHDNTGVYTRVELPKIPEGGSKLLLSGYMKHVQGTFASGGTHELRLGIFDTITSPIGTPLKTFSIATPALLSGGVGQWVPIEYMLLIPKEYSEKYFEIRLLARNNIADPILKIQLADFGLYEITSMELSAESDSVDIDSREGETKISVSAALENVNSDVGISWSVSGDGARMENADTQSVNGIAVNNIIIDNSALLDGELKNIVVTAVSTVGHTAQVDVDVFGKVTPSSVVISGLSSMGIPLSSAINSSAYIAEAYRGTVRLSDTVVRNIGGAKWSLKSSYSGVSINADSGMLTVGSSAASGNIVLVADISGVKGELVINLYKETSSSGSGGGSGGGGSSAPANVQIPGVQVSEEVNKQDSAGVNDYRGHWCEGTIKDLLTKGIISGDPDGSVRPDEFITKEEAIKIFLGVLGISPKQSGSLPSGDTTSSWAHGYILAAMEHGLITGDGTGFINADRNAERAEIVVIVARALGLQPIDTAILDGFSDGNDVPDWCRGYMSALIAQKIIVGFEDSTLRPNNMVTRAEVFAIAHRMVR